MPETSQRLWDSLGASTSLGPLRDQRIGQASDWRQLPPGSPVSKGAALFPRLDDRTE